MRAKAKKRETKPEGLWMTLAKGALLGVLVSALLLLLFAFALEREWLALTSLRVAIIAIKVLSALAAALFVLCKHKRRALPIGALTGLGYALCAFLFFAIVSENFHLSAALLGDLAGGALCGAAVALFMRLLRA